MNSGWTLQRSAPSKSSDAKPLPAFLISTISRSRAKARPGDLRSQERTCVFEVYSTFRCGRARTARRVAHDLRKTRVIAMEATSRARRSSRGKVLKILVPHSRCRILQRTPSRRGSEHSLDGRWIGSGDPLARCGERIQVAMPDNDRPFSAIARYSRSGRSEAASASHPKT